MCVFVFECSFQQLNGSSSNFFFVEQRGEEQGCVEEEDEGWGVHKARGIGVFEKTNNIIGWKQVLR